MNGIKSFINHEGKILPADYSRFRNKLHTRIKLLTLAIAFASGSAMATDYTSTVSSTKTSDNKILNAEDTVSTTGNSMYGLSARGASSKISTNGTKIKTSGNKSHGVYAIDGASIDLTGGAVTTEGESAHGLASYGEDTQISTNGTEIKTSGNTSYGVYAIAGTSVDLTGGAVTTQGESAHGLYVVSSKISMDSTNIKTSGQSAEGFLAISGALIDLTGGSVTTEGESADGLFLYNSKISANGTEIKTSGDNSTGVSVGDGVSIDLTGGSVITAGNYADGLFAYGEDRQISTDGTEIKTSGNGSYGVGVGNGASIDLKGGSVITAGDSAYGLLVSNSGDSQINTNGTEIKTSGHGSFGVYAINDASIDLTGGAVITEGESAYGLNVISSTVSTNSTNIKTSGNSSDGVSVSSGLAALKGGSVTTLGDRSYGLNIHDGDISAERIAIETQGSYSHGVHVRNDGLIDLIDSSVTTTGTDSDGIVIDGNYRASLSNTTVNAQRHGLSFIKSGSSPVTINGGSITAQTGSAIDSHWGTNIVNVNNTSLSGITLLQALSESTIDLNANHSILTGDVVADTSSMANLTLTDNTQWTGAATNASNVEIDTSSAWITTDNSNVAQLTLAGTAGFAQQTDSKKTLTVHHDLIGQNGIVSLNVHLNEGGVLSNQITDRLLVKGNVSGTTYLKLYTSGSGANTDLNQDGKYDSNEGISLVQVAGVSSANSFALAGGYTTIGAAPWSYTLQAYQQGNAGQRVVSGSGDYWDYRLQNLYIDQSGEIVTPDPDPIPTPNPEPTPDPDPIPTPNPEPTPDPDPTPTPNPEPTPDPDPIPAPDPEPTPDPDPTPAPELEPEPENDDPAPDSELPDSSNGNSGNSGNNNSRPTVVPQVASYLSLDHALFAYGARSIGTLHERLGSLGRNNGDRGGIVSQSNNEFYARAFGGDYRRKSNVPFSQFGYDFRQNDRGLQLGGTWLKIEDDQDSWRLGVFGSIGTSHITPVAVDGFSRMKVDAKSIGLTATYQNNDNGAYVDAVIARNYYDTDVDTAARGKDMAKIKNRGWSYSLESGIPFELTNRLIIEPQMQVIYQTLDTKRSRDVDGLVVSANSDDLWIGRAGVRFSKTFSTESDRNWTPWMSMDFIGSHGGTSHENIGGVEFRTGDFGNTFKLGAGITGEITPAVSVYINAAAETRLNDTGEYGWFGNTGVRWHF
ncbi:MAG: autotransporter outer membrane beta-barrel domain-containing protein [Enterobacteriaceae bacterium]|jgi:outer membrane autotransporter protein|nr:autotransporter outer membrane beta-barrel domain-containing protein [Enterobacteriaceae bacterium]